MIDRSSTSSRTLRNATCAAIAALALTSLAACDRQERPQVNAPSASTAMPPSNASGATAGQTAGAAVDDATLTARVKTKLMAEPDVKSLAIDVDSKDGVVTLTGKITSGEERAKAVTAARGVEGVRTVVDKLAAN